VIKKKDGTIVRKVVKETEAQKKLKEMKRLKEEKSGLQEEEAKLEVEKAALKKKEEHLQKMKQERDKLSKKEEFKPPGIKGKILKKVVDENGVEHFIEVDIENEDFDDNASV